MKNKKGVSLFYFFIYKFMKYIKLFESFSDHTLDEIKEILFDLNSDINLLGNFKNELYIFEVNMNSNNVDKELYNTINLRLNDINFSLMEYLNSFNNLLHILIASDDVLKLIKDENVIILADVKWEPWAIDKSVKHGMIKYKESYISILYGSSGVISGIYDSRWNKFEIEILTNIDNINHEEERFHSEPFANFFLISKQLSV
jgi:hypothetical protein